MAGTTCPGSPWSKTCSDSRSGSTEPRNERTLSFFADSRNCSPFDGDWLYWSARLGRHSGVVPSVARLLKKQQGKCAWCGLFFQHGDLWNVDHIVPKSKGGTDATDNLQLLHRRCHLRKHGKSSDAGVNDNHRTTEEPDAGKLCAAERGAEYLTQSGETRREVSGPSGSPEGESRRGKQHAREAGVT